MALQEEFEVHGNYLFRYRGILPTILLTVGIVIFVINRDNSHEFLASAAYEIICLLVSLFGLGIRIVAVAFRYKGTSGRNTRKQVAERLNTSGIYSQLRHPLYLGNFFMSLGIALLVQNFWFITVFVLMYWIYYERIMYAEEQFLRKKFGEHYLQWASFTPAFIPALKKWIKPENTFNWKAVLRNESTCLLSLLLTFFLFETIEKTLEGKLSNISSHWTLYAVLVATFAYVLVKTLVKLKRALFFSL